MSSFHKSRRTILGSIAILVSILSACAQAVTSPSPVKLYVTDTQPPSTPTDSPFQLPTAKLSITLFPPSPSPSSTKTATLVVNSPTPANTLTPTPDTRLTAYYWRNWSVIPSLSSRAIEVFRRGQELGNDLHSFSRIGDCQSIPAVFLGIYDTDRYWLDDDYKYLQLTIDQFAGSFSRVNLTAKDGFGVASVLTPLMSDPNLCQTNETPLECEYRLSKPIIAFIAMGTNWQPNSSASFERYLRQIVEFLIEHGIIPVLVTKADNIEADNLLNRSIAQVAYDYDMPLLNTWAAIQNLPNHGLEENGVYLTTDAWDVRSFTALQALDAIWTTLSSLQP